MINKNDLQNIEKEVVESITNKQLEKLEKKMIEDKLNSKQYCEYFIEYEEKEDYFIIITSYNPPSKDSLVISGYAEIIPSST